ncbi:MAG: class I SAM-dependent methyltransferase [Rhodoplanes sp.]
MTNKLDNPLAVLKSVVPSLAGIRILDVGCGSGGLARLLAEEGAEVTGIDPNPQALTAARTLAPAARFEEASAEALPFEDAAFDVVLVVNALHHVPLDAMDRALAEAARVARPGGWLIVLEPLAAGNFFQALRVVEDETAVRLAAQNALARAIESNRLRLEKTTSYVRREVFADVAQFFARIVGIDPAREATIQANREAANAAALAAAQRDKDGRLVFDQPIKADLLRVVQN